MKVPTNPRLSNPALELRTLGAMLANPDLCEGVEPSDFTNPEYKLLFLAICEARKEIRSNTEKLEVLRTRRDLEARALVAQGREDLATLNLLRALAGWSPIPQTQNYKVVRDNPSVRYPQLDTLTVLDAFKRLAPDHPRPASLLSEVQWCVTLS